MNNRSHRASLPQVVSLFILLILSACRTIPPKNDLTQVSSRGGIGIGFNHTPEGLLISKVLPGSSAEKAGINPGDLIVSCDNIPLNDQPDRRDCIEHIWHSPGQTVALKIKRGDRSLNFKPLITPTPIYSEYAIIYAIVEMLALQERHVVVALLVGKVINNAYFPDENYRLRWQDAISSSLLTQNESNLLNSLGSYNDFHIVDRSTLEAAFKEQKLQLSGAIDAATAKRIGQMLGASHILLLGLSRFNNGDNSFTDEVTGRLIDVEDGTVVATTLKRTPVSH